MSRATAKKTTTPPALVGGLLSKREAAHHISQGRRHVIASRHGLKDPPCVATESWLNGKDLPPFAWERGKTPKEAFVQNSSDRYKIIHQISKEGLGKRKESLKQTVESVLEELITNAIYHAYRKKDGSEKYSRNESVKLSEAEKIMIRYRAEKGGIYLCVSDRGGNLQFEEIANTFLRCYSSPTQIDAKEGGAGLGMYMIFESVTHLKIERLEGKSTVVSCWIADQKTTDPEVFSFNFFERSK